MEKEISFDFYNDTIVRVNNETNIFKNHVRNNENKIYNDSIIIDYRQMYVGSKIISENPVDNIPFLLKQLNTDIRNNLFLKKEHTTNISKFNIETNSIKQIKKNIFFFCYDVFAWAHKIYYGYRYIYYYIELKKQIPDLYLVTREDIKEKFKFILDLLDIKDIIILNINEKLKNYGNTYFVGITFNVLLILY